ncbi:MAG: hypothetical protein ACE5J6_00650 [Candidatus Bathyarchaeia archaeon]
MKKNFTSLAFVSVLLVAFSPIAMVPISLASPKTILYVDPQETITIVGETFVKNVSVANLEFELYGFEFKLCWNSIILDLTEVEIFPPWESYFIAMNRTIKNYNATHSMYWIGVSALAGVGFTGNTTLATFTFKATASGGTILNLYDSKLVSDVCCLPPHIVIDGNVQVLPWSLLGDVNFDGIVDVSDVVLAAVAFGSMRIDDPNTPWDETLNWNPFADLNVDGVVDIFDLVIIGVNYSKTA